MAGKRIDRINDEIQKELSALIRGLKDPRVQGGMLTVTHVETTTDLRTAKVFVSALDKDREKDVIRGLRSAGGYLRRELGQCMRLRYTPELQFIADDSMEQGARILQMLRDPNVVKPPAAGDAGDPGADGAGGPGAADKADSDDSADEIDTADEIDSADREERDGWSV